MTQPDSKPNPKEKQLLDLAGRTPSEGGLDPLEFAQLFPDWQLVEALRREGIVLVGSIRNKASGDEKILRFLTGSLGDAAHAEAVANFRHALIPELVEWATDGGQFYEIRNPCDGDPLAAAIDSGAVTTADVLPAIRGVVDEAAASGVNLRIAPEDVFVRDDGRLTLLPRLAVETEPPASLPDFPGWPAWGSLVGSSIGEAGLANGSQPDPLEGSELGIGGRYKILQRIGEGGFATVYMAEQTVPVRRRVAVKILKAGMDTRQIIARFEAERQALAMMDHPNIAKIFDGGESGLGLPFFAMELVRGTPITDYCDREALDTKSRLRLFLQVCGAVQHAHQKGIIHRDLKPGNVLVTVRDGADPVPKVIDFGVAKALEADLTEKTLFTRFEQLIGTPTYMSPEQAGVDAATGDIDTRADIYALGVLLYELLTGTTPFDAALQRVSFDEVRRVLREEEAQLPSIRLSSIGMDRRTAIANNRGAAVGGLCKLLRGDIDWIVMKAIEKDRRRRYDTANALALDVKRHLEDEPVSAGPPTLAYRAGKYFRRHRVGAAIGFVLLASLFGGLALAGMGFTEAQRNAEIARNAEARLEVDAATLRRINETLLKEVFRQIRGHREPGTKPELVRHTLLRVGQILEAQDDRRPGLDQVAVLIEEHLAEAGLEAVAEANVRADLGELYLDTDLPDLPDRARRWLLPAVERLASEGGIYAALEHPATEILMEALIESREQNSARSFVTQLEQSAQIRLDAEEADRISQELFGRAALAAARRDGRRSEWVAAQSDYESAYRNVPHMLSAGDLLNYSVCCLMAADRQAYESVSNRSLDRFSESDDSRELATATLTYLLATRKRDPARLSQALAMSKKVYEVRGQFYWDALSLGLAEFRTEDYVSSRTSLALSEKKASKGNCATIAAGFLSMEAAQRGDLARAVEHLGRARAIHKGNLSKVLGEHDLGHEWFDLAAARIALQTATELVELATAEAGTKRGS